MLTISSESKKSFAQETILESQNFACIKKDRKKPGRKRTKQSKNSLLLANLPNGFTFIGPKGYCTEDYILWQLKNDALLHEDDELFASNRLSLTENGDARVFTIGCFRIDLDVVKVADLKAMRKMLPKTEYKLIKNRKCARLTRYRRKEETMGLLIENKRLRKENAALRRKLGLTITLDYDTFSDVSSNFQDCYAADCKGQASFFYEHATSGRSQEDWAISTAK